MGLIRKNLILILLIFHGVLSAQSHFIKLEKQFFKKSLILEDDLGYIWITGEDEIKIFDGKNYQSLPFSKIFTIPTQNSAPTSIKKDFNRNTWICSKSGEIIRIDSTYNRISYNFLFNEQKGEHITDIAYNKTSDLILFSSSAGNIYKFEGTGGEFVKIISFPKWKEMDQSIICLSIDNSGNIFSSTIKGMSYVHSLNNGSYRLICNYENRPGQLIKFTVDAFDKVWMTSELDGLFYYDILQNKFEQYKKIEPVNSNLNNPMFLFITADKMGNLWAGTDGDGLYRINVLNDQISIYKENQLGIKSISNNTIVNIFCDSDNNTWLVSKKGDINILPFERNKIEYYSGQANQTPARVLSILESSTGNLMFGTDGNGLTVIDKDGNQRQYNIGENRNLEFKGQYIRSIIEDSLQNIWIATYKNGLWRFNQKDEVFTKIEDNNYNYHPDIRLLFLDSKHRIWFNSAEGLVLLSPNGEYLASFDTFDRSFSLSESNLECDLDGNIYVVSSGKLYRFVEDSLSVSNSNFEEVQLHSGSVLEIKTLDNNHLLLLSSQGVVSKYNTVNKQQVIIANLFSSNFNSIRGLLVENQNSIWVSTKKGIHNYIINKDKVESYYEIDGLQSNEFLKNSYFLAKDGKMYFGGEYGISAFYPNLMKANTTSPQIFINEIEILNKSADEVIPDQIIGRVELIQNIVLQANQNSFSFSFSAIDNILSPNFVYSYMLEGFNNDWINIGEKNSVSFTNINPGDYKLKIRASLNGDSNFVYSQPLQINIKPFWYKSSLAYFIYFVVLMAIFYFTAKLILLKNKLIAEELKNAKEKEIFDSKMDFFSTLSHEIQTPLALILGPIDKMLERSEVANNKLLTDRLVLIKNNAKRLSRITNDLISIRNRELGIEKLNLSTGDLVKNSSEVFQSYNQTARFKDIEFDFQCSVESILMEFDKDKYEHILYNLLSNAFKFTPSDGKISLIVNLDEDNNEVQVIVSDTGSGINKEDKDKIFDMFYQSSSSNKSKGSGIGLSIVKEFVQLHNGRIELETSDSGSSFIVYLPYLKVDQGVSAISKPAGEQSDAIKHSSLPANKFDSNKKTILTIEDDHDMQILISDILSEKYNLLFADNGNQGLHLCTEKLPDLILCDIMMEQMDGFEFIQKIKNSKNIGHIPVIAITANNSNKFKLKSYQAGAIKHMRKPFSNFELELIVENILNIQDKLRLKNKTDNLIKSSDANVQSKDEIFIEKLTLVLNEHLYDPNFKLEDLSSYLNMSYSVIYRNCIDITGKTLVDFVRHLKLRKAAGLIILHGYKISEASYMVGYKDSKYFTKCFKDEFGDTPFNIKKEVLKMGLDEVKKKYKL